MGVRVTAGSISGGGGGGASLVHQASRTLTNDEYIGLTVNEQELAGTPGASRGLVFLRGLLDLDATHGAYSVGPGERISTVIYLGNSACTSNPTLIQTAMTSGLGIRTNLTPLAFIGAGDYVGNLVEDAHVPPDTPLTVFDFWQEATIGGGNALNIHDVGITFLVWNFLTKRFETDAESGWNPSTRSFA